MSGGLKARVLEIVQYEFNPITGEDLHFNENNIIAGLEHKTIKQWAYVAHDRDVYSQKDEEQDPRKVQGNFKPKHWHVVLRCDRAVEVSQIASWFGVSENYVEVKRGHGAFLDCAFYLTHKDEKQQLQGKAVYEFEEIKCSPDLDIRRELQLRKDGNFKIDGKSFKTKKSYYHYRILNGMRLSEIMDEDFDAYTEFYDDFKHYRQIYIDTLMPMPDVRWNIYIEGESGTGKDLISRALARTIVDPNCEMEDCDDFDKDIYFEVGGKNVSFDGYNGQPVIIWTECRSDTLVEKLGGFERVLEFFDLKPRHIEQHIKFGSVVLKNQVNIVNSTQTYKDFCEGLVRGEDVAQSHRRFPMFLIIHEEDYNLGVNKGVFEGTREYNQFMFFDNLQNNFRDLIKDVSRESSLEYRTASAKELELVHDVYLDGVKEVGSSNNPLSMDEITEKYELNSDLRNKYIKVKNLDNPNDPPHFVSLYSLLARWRSELHPASECGDLGDFVPVDFEVVNRDGSVDEELSKEPFLYMIVKESELDGYQTTMLVPDDEDTPF